MPNLETPTPNDVSLPSFWVRNKNNLISAAMVALIAYTVVRSMFRASLRLFWYDELCTWIVTSMPNASAVWHALLRAADGQPPAFYFLESFLNKLIPNQQIAFRLPAILGAGIMLWCIFLWLRRRYGSVIAFAAAVTPLLTVFDSTYSVEARPYALVVACLAVALVCYDRVPTASWTVGLALSLIAAEAFHYYALIAMAPFVAAEVLYAWKRRIIRWRVWAALVSSVVPLIFSWPLLVNFKAYYGQNYWAKPTIARAAGTYGWLFGMPLDSVATVKSTIIAVALAAAAVLIALVLLLRSVRSGVSENRYCDGAIASTFLLLPFVFLAATKITRGGFTERYALGVILGFALAAGYGLSRLSPRASVLIAGLLVFCFATQELSFWLSFRVVRELRAYHPKPIEEMVSAAGHRELPVMVTSANDFLQIAYYSDPQWKKRFVSVVDPEAALKYGIPDSGDKELQVFRDLMPLNVMDYADFRRKYPTFLVCSIPFQIPWWNDPDWWLLRLQADGYRVTVLKTDGRHSIYLVEQARRIT